MILTEELKNKCNTVFNGLFETENANTIASDALWKTVSDKWVDTLHHDLQPIQKYITDVYPDMQVANPNANPVVQVEVITGMGDALVDATDFNQTAITNKYVTVELHHISRPFSLSMYDITHGERVESKLSAAAETVAMGVMNQFMSTLATSENQISMPAMSPETAANISGAFGGIETETLLLDSIAYSKLVPTNGLSLNPDTEGAYGIGHIYKLPFASGSSDGSTFGVALAKDAIVGAVATKEVFEGLTGTSVKHITVAGIPMLVFAEFDFNTHSIKCSVETWAGFAKTDDSRVMTFAFQA